MDTDHYLVVSKIRARISNVRKALGKKADKIAVAKLKDPEVISRYHQGLDHWLE